MKRLALVAFVAFCTFFARTAFAHKPSDSYLTVATKGAEIDVRWDIALRDLSFIMDLDADGDGKITWAEVQKQRDAVTKYAGDHLRVSGTRGDCVLKPKALLAIADHSDGAYVVLGFEGACEGGTSIITIDYSLFFDVDAQHRGLLRLEASSSQTHVFTATERKATFDLAESHTGRQLKTIVKEGILHIWTGYDHVLFLIALLLPAVLRRDVNGWSPVASLKTALLDVLRIVTAFTIAHSITLSLAALGVVTLPSRLIESAIAASVVLAALNNLRPILREDRWLAAFLLGLMHGFGFSAALQDLDLPRSNLVLTLFGFNLGVEIGQVAIVCVFVPIAYAVRSSNVYRRGVLAGGSVIILLLASIWLAERALDVKIIS